MMGRKLVQDVAQREGSAADLGSRAHGEPEPTVAHQEELRAQLPARDRLRLDIAHDLRSDYDRVAWDFKSYDWSSVEAAVGALYKKYPEGCPYPRWVTHHFEASSGCMEFLLKAVVEPGEDNGFSGHCLSLITYLADDAVPRLIADPDFRRELERLGATSDNEKLQTIFCSLREIAERANHSIDKPRSTTEWNGIGLPPTMG